MKIKNKKMSLERKVLAVEAVFVLGVLVYLFFATTPTAVSPIAGQIVSDPDFVFEIKEGSTVLISLTPEFSNPIELEEGEDITLPPGTYYWKVKGLLRDSEMQTFTIESHVGLNLREGKEKDLLENSGNVDVDIEKKTSGITSGSTLSVGESEEVEKGGSYEGKKDE
ncbi:MAG: hypothetical protein ABIH59_02550 [archaeon]